MQVHLTLKSGNAKTGPIPVSTTETASCPTSCPLKESGCYAKSGPLGMHWKAVSDHKRGMNWKEFTQAVATLPPGQLWRHNQAGDLPGLGNEINRLELSQLVKANKGKRGFTYTHKTSAENLPAIRKANAAGFTVNLSANNAAHADLLFKTGLPVAMVLPASSVAHKTVKTVSGNTVVVCPGTRISSMTCDKCRLCSKSDRPFIIGFPAHGSSYKKAESTI